MAIHPDYETRTKKDINHHRLIVLKGGEVQTGKLVAYFSDPLTAEAYCKKAKLSPPGVSRVHEGWTWDYHHSNKNDYWCVTEEPGPEFNEWGEVCP